MSSAYQKLDTEQFLFSIDVETSEFYIGKWDSHTLVFSFSGWLHDEQLPKPIYRLKKCGTYTTLHEILDAHNYLSQSMFPITYEQATKILSNPNLQTVKTLFPELFI